MSNEETLNNRLTALEVRIAYQEETIDDLNKAIVAQWKQIDALNRQVSNLLDRVQETESRTSTGARLEPPPPHY